MYRNNSSNFEAKLMEPSDKIDHSSTEFNGIRLELLRYTSRIPLFFSGDHRRKKLILKNALFCGSHN